MAISRWPDKEQAEEMINNKPGLMAQLLAEHLEQADLDALNAKMFPPAPLEQQERALKQTRQLLLRNGFLDTAPMIQQLDAEL